VEQEKKPEGQLMNFKERFCAYANCPPEKYVERVAVRCMHPEHPWLARLYFLWDKESFASDLEMIQRLATTTSFGEFKSEMQTWRSGHPSKDLIRKEWKLRVSGKMLLKLASRVFRHTQPNQPASEAAPSTSQSSASGVSAK